jgi:hypothetical protein
MTARTPRRPTVGASLFFASRRKGIEMAGLLWTVLVVLVVLWLIGFVAGIGGGLIHLLLVIAVIILVVNLLTGRSAV